MASFQAISLGNAALDGGITDAMVLGLVLSCVLSGADLSGWHTYAPPGSALKFAMPGAVHIQTKADETGAAKLLYKCYAKADGIDYVVVWGEPTDKLAGIDAQLWESARTGQTVQIILANTLDAAAKASQGTRAFKKFGVMRGFPVLAELFDHPDGSGTNTFAAFTKHGIVVVGARGPRTQAAAELEIKFLGSVDLSARQ